jgi:hypothetical protein
VLLHRPQQAQHQNAASLIFTELARELEGMEPSQKNQKKKRLKIIETGLGQRNPFTNL